MALTKAVKEGIWLKELVNDVELYQEKAIAFCDTQSVICLSKDQVFHDKMKQIRCEISLHPY